MFYIVHVCSGRRKWKLDKRFNEFYELDTQLRIKHANLPALPPKTYFPLKLDQDIEQRRAQLHHYLQVSELAVDSLKEIVNRPDIRTSSQFRTWLDIDT